MTSDDIRRELDAISAEFRGQLPGRLAGLEALWRELAGGAFTTARLADLHRGLHSLAGSAKTFGVAGVGEAAAVAESFLEPYCERGVLPGPADRLEFERLLEALKRSAPSK